MENMELWDGFKETPPSVTKAFQKGGGFKGKAIDPMYVIESLTRKFGPVGTGWGWEITGEDYVTGAPFKKGDGHTIIHKIKLHLWYQGDKSERCFTGEQFGLTTFVGEYASGPFTDEEHAKKSVTDAVGKCAVQLGIAADVHMGLHDDCKYVNGLKEKEKGGAPKDTSKAGVDDIPFGGGHDKSESTRIDNGKAKILFAKWKNIPNYTDAEKNELLVEWGIKDLYSIEASEFEKYETLLRGFYPKK